jgi:hypothetical protein
MKVLINESRLRDLAKTYIKKNLCEYIPSDIPEDYSVGVFYKDSEYIGGIARRGSFLALQIKDSIYYSCQSMFGQSPSEARGLLLEAVNEMTGEWCELLYLIEFS